MVDSFDVNDNSGVYYDGSYWNDLEAVRQQINRCISGDGSLKWYEHFAKKTNRVFERALILNCGNGWVERELLEHGLVREAVGIDYSENLLDEARAAALRGGYPLTYHQVNINTAALPEGEFDLVVNHAAAHHVAAIDKVFRALCSTLPEDGWFVSFDYVGPHRNQYRLDAWEEAWKLNEELPPSLRQELVYPPLTVMLQVDPTEAIHSELIVDTFRRYFVEHEFAELGGAVAYPLLTHNARMFAAPDDEERARWVDRILLADERFLQKHPDSTLFAYFAGTPRKSVLTEDRLLAEWNEAETERERCARDRGGEYYERGPLAAALIQLEEAHAEEASLRAQLEQVRSELDAVRSTPLYAQARRALDAELTRRIRANSFVAAVERRVRR